MRLSVNAKAVAAALCLVAAGSPAAAQNAAPPADAGAAQQQQQLWSVRCTASTREAPPDFAIEQRAVVTETGRLLTQFTVRVPADTRKPVLMIQAPLGPFLPGGITLDIDGAGATKLDYQTCDANGCYAGSPVPDELLQAKFRGQKLNITLHAPNNQPVKIPMELTGFTAAYRSIQ
jgi:invasion protein IalB